MSSRYTLEDWRTREVEIKTIPTPVFELSFEEILEVAFGRLGSLELNTVELLFSCIFFENDWRVIRTPVNRDDPAMSYIVDTIERTTGVRDALYGSGVPDFFLWKLGGQHRFVEIKAGEDSINENQREWATKYDWDLYIAQLAEARDGITEDEIIAENRIRRP